MANLVYNALELETETIQLQRFVALAEHHYAEHDPACARSTANLELAIDLLTDKVAGFLAWLENNDLSTKRKSTA